MSTETTTTTTVKVKVVQETTTTTTTLSEVTEEKEVYISDFLDLRGISNQGERNYYTRHFSPSQKIVNTIAGWEEITKLKSKD